MERAYDGDTIYLTLDMLLFKMADVSCRLAGLNTRELAMPGGHEARDFVKMLIPVGTLLTVKIVRLDKYAGRFDGLVSKGTVCINDHLIQLGWAVPWDGKGPAPIPEYPPVPATWGRASMKWMDVDV